MQRWVVLLRKVNILAAAQTHRHVSDTSRMVGVIERPPSTRKPPAK
jgi:hypothetical protein